MFAARMLASFQFPAYRWLWFSNLAGSAGRWAMVLVLSAQLLQLTHSSFWVGLGLFLTQGPVVLAAPYSGVMADRFDRRLLNVVSAAVASATTAAFALLTWAGLESLPAMLLLSLLFGLSFVFQMTLRSTLVPSQVPPEKLLNAVSLFQVGTQGAQFLGPALATPLLVAAGPASAWSLCAVLYATSALLSAYVGESRGGQPPGADRTRLRDSLAYLRARPLAWTAVLAVAIHCSLTMAYQGMLPMFVSMDLGAGGSSYGVLLTTIGLGAVIGSLGLARLADPRHRSKLFVLSLVGSGACLTAMAAAGSVEMAVVFAFFVGATQAMFMSMTLALIQGSVDNQFRGRATSFYQMITLAPMAIFGWGMGGLADVTQPRPLMEVSGVLFLLAMAAYMLWSPWLRRLLVPAGWKVAPIAVEEPEAVRMLS
jgi:MFS family permease